MKELHARQQAAFRDNPNPSLEQRRGWLAGLLKSMLARQEHLIAAVNADFSCRSRAETLYAEIYTTASAIRHARSNVASWMRPKPRPVPLTLQPGQAWIQPQPVGVVGIISPWNFPVNLALIPMAAALSAGNRVILKPSELTPATAEVLRELLGEAFTDDQVAVVTGDADVGREFAGLPLDHLLFTGSTAVGREVMKAASANLTPVTLELGGKSPALITRGARLGPAAASIAYGKLTNAGQICIAPDYVLIPRLGLRAFVEKFSEAARGFYPGGVESADYTAIISDKHHARLAGYVAEARSRGVEVIAPFGDGGTGRKLAPALLLDPPDDLRVMQEEIFGPILPLKPYDSLDQAIQYVNARPRPLTFYLFTQDSSMRRQVLERTISGGMCINDTLTQFAVDGLPFGGIGPSGMGRYHGEEGFQTFSHGKPVFRSRLVNPAAIFRPPSTRLQRWVGRFLIGK